jgi:menaquinone-9 beta-reductase
MLVAANGKHDLRGHPRPAGLQREMVAFKQYFRLAAGQREELGSAVEVLLFPGGYAGLQPVEKGLANLCLVVDRKHLRRYGNSWSGLLAAMQAHSPHLARRLAGAEPQLARPLALSSIPYGFVRKESQPGFWPLGDQFAVIPSFTGDGMSIALHSAFVAVRAMCEGRSSESFVNTLRSEVQGQVRLATLFAQWMVRAPRLASAARLWPGSLRYIAGATRLRRLASEPRKSVSISETRS